ncbi:MAG: acyl-CoA dehydratase activase [Candidatus Aegiribacteria sp.]|nr:acyl-CoA dehydratase activase [Candidatus Aegiribacteria sp.]
MIRRIGIDMGSVSTKVVLTDGNSITAALYRRHHGKPVDSLVDILSDLEGWEGSPAAFTGSAARSASSVAGCEVINEVVALAASIPIYCPEAKSVIEMGGQDSKLLLFRQTPDGLIFDDFSMNSVCAAGTGSFLDQQASRLGLKIEELGELALQCSHPPRIAGRCSVFAKSDMIHLQQIGTPVSHIVAGLCFAVARNFKSSIASGRDFRPPVAFVGGVAANKGMVDAFREVLGSEFSDLIIPENFRCLTAAGAALAANDGEYSIINSDFTSRLLNIRKESSAENTLRPLRSYAIQHPESRELPVNVDEPVYLGIDVGSISTNLVALGETSGKLLASEYLMTAGRPLEAVKQGLSRLEHALGTDRKVIGLGTTGSGRYMTGDFTGADVIRNEITAQARAAVETDPAVDTIFEIGGQDSKYISLEKGRVIDFEMNKVCAAGTGSFLEEQAEKLGLDIREFGPLALSATTPCGLGERCTVFMESDVFSQQADGASVEDIVAGLSYSIVKNYLHRVVGEKKIGNHIFFQGGTAFNTGVAAAFNAVLKDKQVIIPDDHHVTGAIGAALLAKEEKPPGPSKFKGFILADEKYRQETFICEGCPNRCEIHRIILHDGKDLFYGGRCEKYETESTSSTQVDPGTNWFKERETLLMDGYTGAVSGNRPLVGIPRALWFWEFFPFFRTFFEGCGFDVIISGTSTSSLIHSGVESVAAETCFPVKLAHGHVMDLLEKDIDYLFLPSILRSFPNGDFTESYNCPYIEASPYIIDSGLGLSSEENITTLSPVLDFSLQGREWMNGLVEMAAGLDINTATARKAASEAKSKHLRFRDSLLKAGKRALEEIGEDQPAFVIISRPYNGADAAVNVGLPDKLAKLGASVIPTDFLELPLKRAAEIHRNMYWQYGQRIIAAALAIREDPRLNGVYITNFGCGPDSFIQHEVAGIMGEKPMLTIEIDEHAADAGVITRCEAFMDAIKGRRQHGTSPFLQQLGNRNMEIGKRTVWVPWLGDATWIAVAAARKHGVKAIKIPPTNRDSVALGRSVTTGKECYPAIITAGNMLSVLKDNEPSETAFFIGTASGPCRFGQYCSYHRILLDRLGYEDVPILTATSSDSYTSVKELSTVGFQVDMLKAAVAGDVLKSALYRVRPYELKKGSSDMVLDKYLAATAEAMSSGRSLIPVLEEAASEFMSIPRSDVPKPLILMFGEIYVRNDPFAHSQTDLRIEALGGEVLYTPLMEWFEYVNHSFISKSKDRKQFVDLIKGYSRMKIMKRIRRKLEAPFSDLLTDRPGLEPEEIMKAAHPYMKENIGGEAILCVGAPLAFNEKAAIDGAINIFPFTCLPGTVVTAISKKIRKEHRNLPWLNLAFDGQEDTDNEARLTAFMYQVRQNFRVRSAKVSDNHAAAIEIKQ